MKRRRYKQNIVKHLNRQKLLEFTVLFRFFYQCLFFFLAFLQEFENCE
ncbi:unnamed protein product [Brugia timori]|uniref:Uncharacterized protein n=1 Tax=Brugia timori TaxID=42155 RepID=A0A0R3RAP7_9BILA|nr:unnamed protein product [Brugia timori]